MLKITVDGKPYKIQKWQSIKQFIETNFEKEKKSIYACYINNDPVSLNFKVTSDDLDVQLIRHSDEIGKIIYRKSLCFLLHRVIFELFRNSRIVQGTALGDTYYYDFYTDIPVTENLLRQIALKMREYIKKEEEFEHFTFSKKQAIEYFEKRGFYNKAKLIEQMNKEYIAVYSSGPYKDIDFSPLLPDAGYIKDFWLKKYDKGFLLCFSGKANKNELLIQIGKREKLFKTFIESKKWGRIIEVNNVRRLNDIILHNKTQEVVNICESLHEKKIAQIADEIKNEYDKRKIRLILIAGPSSSGKTTFTKRLAIHLKINGLNPIFISLDNYYIDREKTPKDENGNYDFENIMALDIKLLNEHLTELIDGNEIEAPLYDFEIGKRKEKGITLRIDEYQPIIIEGIHGLNPLLTKKIDDNLKFKIYVSALTPIAIDDYNRIPSSDNRLLRRIVRDYKYRNYNAAETIKQWPSVRKGEEKYIFPYQENADVFFNSAHHFELSVLKEEAEKYLNEVPWGSEEYKVAYRLLNFLSIFKPIDRKYIPANSILREFIGGSCFKY